MRISVHRVIKLLTLVQDSSIEQKVELFPLAKIRTIFETPKKIAEKLIGLQFFLQFIYLDCDRRIWIILLYFI